ncbi:uncharacterized protein SCHCODRAFT_02516039 [Schizophyllum commune H4-8]|uniref:Uncharacterized protein n=1 Tax=Schizophyllum commune (strain H4-8 / FGSC 9210) TaxID=578458 RepID=D8QI21_SCHCM|nr:uncharacterized protein SCHCODRAFT_02516039 [Schizophyllum commune H4-8]KAI5887390.1 hypothetical protein SCHCODRAFT_02516039 [Schizophyllum commune H4-8]
MYSPSSPSGWRTTSVSAGATPAGSTSALMRKKGSSEEMTAENEQARLRGALEGAYNGMYGEDESQPSETNTLRKRIALLVQETNLQKEHVVDRGLSSSNGRARFTLRADFVTNIQEITQLTQQVIDLLQIEFREEGEEWWQFDPSGALLKGLTEARSIDGIVRSRKTRSTV